MRTWLRRIKGAIGIGLTWGVAWSAAGVVTLLVVGVGAADVPFPLFFGMLGFLSGVTFSVVLGVVAGRRKFADMSLLRFAALGAVGGAVLSGIVFLAAGPGVELLVMGPVFASAGAISAAGTLALARRSEGHELSAASQDAKGETFGRPE